MIYSITFNPALDISGVVNNLVIDEKNYVSSEKIKPGGNGVNAGIIANRLKAPVILSGFLGGENGRKLRSLLYEEKVPHLFVLVRDQTRINFTIANASDHHQTRLSFGGPHE